MGAKKSNPAVHMEDGAVQVKKRSQFQETWRRLKKNRMAMLGLFVITLLILVSIFADFIFDYNDVVIKQDTSIRLEGPSSEHWLGTAEFGWHVSSMDPEFP